MANITKNKNVRIGNKTWTQNELKALGNKAIELAKRDGLKVPKK